MNTLVQWFQSLSGDGSLQGFLMAGAIKGTLILALALTIAKLLNRASAATRHLTVTLGLAALLMIPFFAVLLPTWRLAVLPAAPPERLVSSEIVRPEAVSEGMTEVESTNASSEVGEKPASVLGTTLELARITGAVETRKIDLLERLIAGAGDHWKRILVLIWLSVAFLLLSRLVIGMVRIGWIVRHAERVEDETALELMDSAREHLQLQAWPRLLRSNRVQVPLVWGFFRPVLILPRDSRSWPVQRLRVVLLHELAHVKRFDGLTLLLTSAVAAVYWFHPLVWLADRFGRRECERACDDLVLQSGTRPSEYADHLLSIARALPEAEALGMVTLAMSRGSQLEGRLLAILHPAIRRGNLSSRVVLAAAAVTMLLAAPLATIELRAKPAPLSTGLLSAGSLSPVTRSSGSSVRVVEFDPFQAEYDFPGDPTDLQLEVRASDEEISSDPDIDKGPKGDKWNWKNKGSDTWFDRGMELHNQERFDEAREAFQKSIEEGHRVSTAMYNIACGYSMKNDRDNALIWLEKAFENGFNMAGYLLEDSDLDPLRTDVRFKKLVEKHSIEHHERKKYDSGSARKRDRLEGTLQKYGTLMSEKSSDGERWYKVGSDLLRIRELDKGIDSLKRAVDLLGYRGETAMYNLACAYALRGDRELALQWLEKSIYAGFGSDEKLRHDPDLTSIRNHPRFTKLVETTRLLELDLGHDKWDDSLDEAIERHERFVRSNPNVGRGWFNLGFALQSNGDYRKAIDAFDRAIKLDHRVPTSMYNIACGYSRLNQKDEAIAWLQKASDAGFELKNYIHHDDDLKNLRSDPRFKKLREQNRSEKGNSWEFHLEN